MLNKNCFYRFYPTNATMYPLAKKLVVVYYKASFLLHYYLRCILITLGGE